MSDAIARELALEAYQAAPVGAELTSSGGGTPAYAVKCGDARAVVGYYGPDEAGTDLYLYTLSVLDMDGLHGGPVWESFASDAGDASRIRAALLTWARAL